MARFADMLDRKAEDIKQPPLLPPGIYELMVSKAPEEGEVKTQDGQLLDKLTFQMSVVQPIEVDEDSLAEFGKVAGQPVRIEFLLPTDEDRAVDFERSLVRVKNFLRDLGVFDDETQLGEAIGNAPSMTCNAEIGHRPDKNDPDKFYIDVRRTFAV